MGINRIDENTTSKPFDGVLKTLLTGKETGSKMLSVNKFDLEPNSKSNYYDISNVEESLFVVEGQIEFRLGNNIFNTSKGDCIIAKKGQSHGFGNAGNSEAVVITVSPNVSVNYSSVNEPDFVHETPDQGYFDRSKNEPYEFAPGIMRYDMVGDFLGAESTYFSELILEPGAIALSLIHI